MPSVFDPPNLLMAHATYERERDTIVRDREKGDSLNRVRKLNSEGI